MTIVPLATPYNQSTHVRIVNINLDSVPSVAHFRLGEFTPEAEVPEMPYSAEELPAGWSEREELNTANLPIGITSLSEVLTAIETELQNNA